MSILHEKYEELCKENDEAILNNKTPKLIVCYVNDEEYKIHTIDFKKNKIKAINSKVKSIAVKYGVDGYIVISSTVFFSKKNDNYMIRILCSPHEKITEIVSYKDGKILGKERHLGRTRFKDNWDAWNEGEIETSIAY